jgi:hypothetical protein
MTLMTAGRAISYEGRWMTMPVFYRTIKVDGLSIFYREAAPRTGRLFWACTAFHHHCEYTIFS